MKKRLRKDVKLKILAKKQLSQRLTKKWGSYRGGIGESETCEFMALGSVVVVGGLHPALWQPQISSQKRLNLYSIFFHQGYFVHQTCGKGERKTIRIWKVLCKRLQTEKFRRITWLHFATQSDSNFMLWQKYVFLKFSIISQISSNKVWSYV